MLYTKGTESSVHTHVPKLRTRLRACDRLELWELVHLAFCWYFIEHFAVLMVDRLTLDWYGAISATAVGHILQVQEH